MDEWIHDAVAPSGFFAFDGHKPPLDYSSWFMAAMPGDYIVEALWVDVRRYWARPRKLLTFKETGGFQRNYELDPMMVAPGGPDDTFPFFWIMYLFTYLLRTDARFREHWERTPRMSALVAHQLQFGIGRPGFDILSVIRSSPVHKLTWKSDALAEAFNALDVRLRET